MSGRSVLSPSGIEHIVVVIECATPHVHTDSIHAVIIEVVGVESCLVVGENHISPGLGSQVVALIEECVADECERVTLSHFDMSEGIERIVIAIELSAVAVHDASLVAEFDMSDEYLRPGVLVVFVKDITVEEIDPVVRSC